MAAAKVSELNGVLVENKAQPRQYTQRRFDERGFLQNQQRKVSSKSIVDRQKIIDAFESCLDCPGR